MPNIHIIVAVSMGEKPHTVPMLNAEGREIPQFAVDIQVEEETFLANSVDELMVKYGRATFRAIKDHVEKDRLERMAAI